MRVYFLLYMFYVLFTVYVFFYMFYQVKQRCAFAERFKVGNNYISSIPVYKISCKYGIH